MHVLFISTYNLISSVILKNVIFFYFNYYKICVLFTSKVFFLFFKTSTKKQFDPLVIRSYRHISMSSTGDEIPIEKYLKQLCC